MNAEAFPEAPADLLRDAVRHTLRAEAREQTEISLTLLADADIRRLNRDYLGHDRATDVIAFTLGEPPGSVGDVYVGLEQARRQAAELDVALDEELVRLAVHGTLHVLGHDHPEGEERARSAMYERQEALIRDVLARRGFAE